MIKLIRLISGEEVVAAVKEVDGGYNISDPALIVPTEKGIGLMDMMPYSSMGESETFIKESAIVFITEPVAGLLKKYKSLYSKIITPDSSLII